MRDIFKHINKVHHPICVMHLLFTKRYAQLLKRNHSQGWTASKQMVCVPLPHWSKQQKGYAHLVSTIAKGGVALVGSMSTLDINSVIACSRLVRLLSRDQT